LREQPSLQTHCEEPLHTCPAPLSLLLQATTAKTMAIELTKREAPVRMFMRPVGARRMPRQEPGLVGYSRKKARRRRRSTPSAPVGHASIVTHGVPKLSSLASS
jgi:hypothetical protein